MKKIKDLLILTICLCFNSAILAQDPGVIQVKNGMYSSNINQDVCFYNGMYYSVGAREITCRDQNLDIVWTTSINSTIVGFSNTSRIIITKGGNIVCGGITTNNEFSTYIIKLRTDGTVIFQREYYLPNKLLPSLAMTLFALSPATGVDDGFVMGGGTCGDNNLLIKCDKDGNIEWSRHHLIPNSSNVQGVYAENNGYVIVSTCANNNIPNTMLWGCDANGNPQWSHFLSTTYAFGPNFPKIRKLLSGRLAFICSSNEPGYPVYVCTFDPGGTNIQLRKISTHKQIALYDLAEDTNGDLVLCGYMRAVPQNDPNAQRSILLKLKTDNTIGWAKQSKILSNLGPVLTTVLKTPAERFTAFGDGAVAATVDKTGDGLCASDTLLMTATTGTFTEIFPGILKDTAYVLMDTVNYEITTAALNKVTLCNTIGIAELTNDVKNLKVYPNPNNGNFNLQFDDQFNEGKLNLFDQMGRMVFSTRVHTGSNTIVAEGLAAGLYHFTVYDNHRPFAKGKFVVE